MLSYRQYSTPPGTPAPMPICAPGIIERFFQAARPYVTATPPAEPLARLAPVSDAAAREGHVMDVEIVSPAIRSGDEWTEHGRTVCVPVPEGAKRYFVRFSPVTACRQGGSTVVPNVTPFGVLEPPQGEIPSGENLLRVTPVWARLSEEPVSAGSVRAVLSVEFTTK